MRILLSPDPLGCRIQHRSRPPHDSRSTIGGCLRDLKPYPCGYYGHPRRRCRCTDRARLGYQSRLSGPLLDRLDVHVSVPPVEVSALTGACLLVSREVFDEVGGFDERFVVSGNDTDFCLRVARTGRANIWTPDSVLIHHEGRSRRAVAYLGDESRLWDSWSERLRAGDPYFNPNLAPDRLDCSLDATRLR